VVDPATKYAEHARTPFRPCIGFWNGKKGRSPHKRGSRWQMQCRSPRKRGLQRNPVTKERISV